jgi:hypothetical protein
VVRRLRTTLEADSLAVMNIARQRERLRRQVHGEDALTASARRMVSDENWRIEQSYRLLQQVKGLRPWAT